MRRRLEGWRRDPLVWASMAVGLLVLVAAPLLAQTAPAAHREYGDFPVVGGRVAVWVAAQVHLMFAAFVLGVPMFAVVAEGIGLFGRDQRYDRLAKEFTRLLLIAYSATAIWGAVLVFFLTTIYPRFWSHLAEIFEVSMWIYVGLFFVESFTLYLYYYGWERWHEGRAKLGHWGVEEYLETKQVFINLDEKPIGWY